MRAKCPRFERSQPPVQSPLKITRSGAQETSLSVCRIVAWAMWLRRGVPVPLWLVLAIIARTRADNDNATVATEQAQAENALAKLVKIFSKPGAFKRIDAILGENTIEESTSCPKGDEGLECRRAEARRSVDCPQGDCYCYNCATAGPELWASCCRESLRCCSHLAAACRTCDHPVLYPFCSKHFKKCLNRTNDEKQQRN